MEELLFQAVLPVISTEPAKTSFGTAFTIYQSASETLFVTCAHVVEAVGGPERLRLKTGETDLPVEVIATGLADSSTDLAVLRVNQNLGKTVLALATNGQVGTSFVSLGSHDLGIASVQARLMEPISGNLGQRGLFWTTKSQPVPYWSLNLLTGSVLQGGYSGAPVVDARSGWVIGIISVKLNNTLGIALSSEALKIIWPESHSQLEFLQVDSKLIARDVLVVEDSIQLKLNRLQRDKGPEERKKLDKLTEILFGIERIHTLQVRDELVQILPNRNYRLSISRSNSARMDLINIVQTGTNFSNGLYELIGVVRQLVPESLTEERLNDWLNEL